MLRLALLVVFAAVAALATQRCDLRCYSGTVEWGNGTSLDYSFSLLPCQPVVVVEAALTDDTARTPTFDCASSEHVVSIVLDHGDTHLEWRYETDSSCEQVLSSLDTIPGVFLGTNHRRAGTTHAKQDGASLEEAQRLCERRCEVCVDTGVILARGSAGEKSPCGAEGTDECAMRVQWRGDVCTSTLGAFEVFVGTDVVPLSAYQPDAMLGAALSCNDDGRITVESQGVMLEYGAPELHNGNCEAMWSRVNPLASGSLKQAMVQLSADEMWTATQGRSLAGSEVYCDAMEAPLPPVREDDGDNKPAASSSGATEDGTSGETVPPVGLPVDVFVNCSRRRAGQCCTIYGYRNRNPVEITAAAVAPYNYFIPSPATRSQVSVFQANTTQTAAFAVQWECPEYERHKLRWVLDLPAENRSSWRRTADGARERNDCSDALYNQWCT